MYSDEETELRDLIVQNLENCGFLNKIKAELRAGVFLALEEDGNLKNKIPLCNPRFDDFVTTSEGKLIVSLIREFLEYYSLNFTLSVFEAEAAAALSCTSRSELCDQVNLRSSEVDGPVILTLLKEVIGNRNNNFPQKSSDNFNSVSEKSVKALSSENVKAKDILEEILNQENPEHKERTITHMSFEKDNNNIKSTKHSFEEQGKEDSENKTSANTNVLDIFKQKSDQTKRGIESNIFNESNEILSPDHDPFFDEPLPSERTLFTFSDPLKDKSESKLNTNAKRDLDDSKKSSLSSLKDLPSLTGNHEWAFNREPKNTLPSLDSLKSVSSSDASNEEVINLDKGVFGKKDSDIVESNESSEKQISEESIEEDIDESSVGFEDLLASSLSLADDVTTDQTVSQGSVVEGVDHVEACKN